MGGSLLRTVILRPYRKGIGPSFMLRTWDTGRTDSRGSSAIRYELSMLEPGEKRRVLFKGEDFHGSPMHAIDSDESVKGLLSFLTLRPGDTDREYFENYTTEQCWFCDNHAEALSCEAMSRFGE